MRARRIAVLVPTLKPLALRPLHAPPGDRVESPQDLIGIVALALGNESENTFGTAFKHVMGVSPRQFGRDRDSAPKANGAAALTG